MNVAWVSTSVADLRETAKKKKTSRYVKSIKFHDLQILSF